MSKLKRQIEWLSECMNKLIPQLASHTVVVDPGTDSGSTYVGNNPVLTPVTTTPSESGNWQNLLHEDNAVTSDQADPFRGPRPPQRSPGEQVGLIPSAVGKETTRRQIPVDIDVRECVGAFFSYVHEAYPFFDQIKVMEDVETLAKSDRSIVDPVPTKLYMLVAIGWATLFCAGRVSDDMSTRLSVPYHDIICECWGMSSVESVEILFLLALYSVYDPSGMSPWVLCGVLGRQVIAFGLNRRSRAEHGLTALEVELRHRLFWSIYELDRMIAASFGLPVAINDENINIPLPGVTVEEYAASEQSHYTRILQVSRNAIALRDLEGRILQTIHLSSSSSATAFYRADRRAIIEDFRSQIDDWYAQGCLLSRLEKDNVQFHNTITWLNVRYHSLLALLYSPSRFNSQSSPSQIFDLHRTIQQYVHCSAVQLQQRHFSLNRITLNRLLFVCVILLFCLIEGHRVKACRVEARGEISLCIQILEAFPDRWALAQRSLVVFRRLESLLRLPFYAGPESLVFNFSSPLNRDERGQTRPEDLVIPDLEDSLGRITEDALALICDGLGPSSAYNNFLNQARTPEGDGDELWSRDQTPNTTGLRPSERRGMSTPARGFGLDLF